MTQTCHYQVWPVMPDHPLDGGGWGRHGFGEGGHGRSLAQQVLRPGACL